VRGYTKLFETISIGGVTGIRAEANLPEIWKEKGLMSQSKHNHNSGLGNDPGHYEIIAYWKYTHRDWRFIPGILLRFAALFVFCG